MVSRARTLAILPALSLAVSLFSAHSTSAATSLYRGSIRIVLSYGAFSSYSIPFGSNISYPHMNNLPVGDLATIDGSGPAAIGFDANQLTLRTSLFTTSPPASWSVSEAFTEFSGGHTAGKFFGSGAPGAASSAPVSGIPASQFGVSFKGTPNRFGGTLALLGNHRSRWGAVLSPSSHYCGDFSIGPGTDCSIWELPLSPIGGTFGGTAFGRASIVPGASPTLFDQTLWGFPWTTGTVTARAPLGMGGVNSLITKGSDQRTAAGAGNLKLVTPFVIRWTEDRHASPPVTGYQAGIAIVDLRFVPEPSALLAFASGILALAGLYTYSRRPDRPSNGGSCA
jgi:hypothetical protein